MLKPSNKIVPWYEFKASAKKGTAEITIYDVIGGSYWDEGVTGKGFVKDLAALPDHDTLNIYINSLGGSIYDGQLIYNALMRHKAHKVVHIDGLAASMASVIAMVGDEVIMPGNALMMIHDPLTVAIGNAADMRETANVLDKYKLALIPAYREKTGLDDKEISDMMSAETWMDADTAVEKGFADRKTEDVAVAAIHDVSMFKNAPRTAQIFQFTKPQDSVTEPKEGETTVELTLDKVKADYPAIATALIAEGKKQAEAEATAKVEAARKEGAEAERARVKSIDDISKGHEHMSDLIAEMKADPTMTGEKAAIKLLAEVAKSNTSRANDLHEDGKNAAAGVSAVNIHAQETKPAKTAEQTQEEILDGPPITEEEARKLWNEHDFVRKEFPKHENFFKHRQSQA